MGILVLSERETSIAISTRVGILMVSLARARFYHVIVDVLPCQHLQTPGKKRMT